MWRIRIANLPPEVTETSIRAALLSYGEIVSIQDEIWPKAYRYKVANGVKVIVSITVLWRPASYMLRVWKQWTYKSGMPQKVW